MVGGTNTSLLPITENWFTISYRLTVADRQPSVALSCGYFSSSVLPIFPNQDQGNHSNHNRYRNPQVEVGDIQARINYSGNCKDD